MIVRKVSIRILCVFAAAFAVDNRRQGIAISKPERVLLEGVAGIAALALRSKAKTEGPCAVPDDSDWLATLGGLSSCLLAGLAAPELG